MKKYPGATHWKQIRNFLFCQTSLCLLLLKGISTEEKNLKSKYTKQQLPLFKFPWHGTWFINPLWCLDPCFPARAKANCFQESPSSVCLQTIPSWPIRQTSGMGTAAQLRHGASVWDSGQALVCRSSSEDAEVSVRKDKWTWFWH